MDVRASAFSFSRYSSVCSRVLFYEANLYDVFAYLRKSSRFRPSDSWEEPLQTAWHKVARRMEALLPSWMAKPKPVKIVCAAHFAQGVLLKLKFSFWNHADTWVGLFWLLNTNSIDHVLSWINMAFVTHATIEKNYPWKTRESPMKTPCIPMKVRENFLATSWHLILDPHVILQHFPVRNLCSCASENSWGISPMSCFTACF